MEHDVGRGAGANAVEPLDARGASIRARAINGQSAFSCHGQLVASIVRGLVGDAINRALKAAAKPIPLRDQLVEPSI